jgi:hypothetical protein
MGLSIHKYLAALALPNGERAAYLDEACAANPELRERIEPRG